MIGGVESLKLLGSTKLVRSDLNLLYATYHYYCGRGKREENYTLIICFQCVHCTIHEARQNPNGPIFFLLESFINGSMILEAAKNLDEIVL